MGNMDNMVGGAGAPFAIEKVIGLRVIFAMDIVA